MSRVTLSVLILLPVLLLGGCWAWVLSKRQTNELESLGVHIEWHYGATSSVPSIKVWWESGNNRIDAPNVFGGIENPKMSFQDVDGDGTKDIIFGNAKYRQVVAFHPASDRNSLPTFVIVENTAPGP